MTHVFSIISSFLNFYSCLLTFHLSAFCLYSHCCFKTAFHYSLYSVLICFHFTLPFFLIYNSPWLSSFPTSVSSFPMLCCCLFLNHFTYSWVYPVSWHLFLTFLVSILDLLFLLRTYITVGKHDKTTSELKYVWILINHG